MIKDASLSTSAVVSVSNFNQVSPRQVSFDIQTDETSPFLFMELADNEVKDSFDIVYGSNAGWFSDNNFVAEGGRVYSIVYSSFSTDISVSDL